MGPVTPDPPVSARRLYTPPTFSVQGPLRTVQLEEHEWALLSLLFEYRGAYLTQDTILSRIWGPYYVNQGKPFRQTLASLRGALKCAGYPNDMIREESDIGIGIPGLNGEPIQRGRV